MSTRPASYETLANYLAFGYWEATGQNYHRFDTSSSNVVTVNLTSLTAAGKNLARKSLDAWEAVADVSFREVSGSAKITFDDSGSGAVTYAKMSGHTTVSAEVVIGAGWLQKYGSAIGGYAHQTYLHEIGHALGLGHSGTYSGGATFREATFSSDSWQSTVMSYLDQNENPTVAASKAYVISPMMSDILAIQQLYGRARGGETAGNTVYSNTTIDGHMTRNTMTIYDEQGNDTIDFRSDKGAQSVSMSGGSYSDVYGLKGNLGIAKGTVVENYFAGAGNDRIVGNNASNKILGGNGGDALFGAGGNDKLYGQAGSDKLVGDAGSDKLVGEDGNDQLLGGSGHDWLFGGNGNDRLVGGHGNDTFVFTADRDWIVDFTDNQDRIALDDQLWGGGKISAQRILSFAHVQNGNIVFDFGDGDTLTLVNRTNIQSLADDLLII